MKEFSAQTGGRYTYIDDIVNLQDLALAFASIFDDCDNFIISGCRISGTSISEGYVYINGKIRHFSGVSGVTTWPQYLYESNKTETVAYASGSDKVGRNNYGCAIAASVPTSIDSLTNAVPSFIKLTADGGTTINDALFGKYSLLLQSAPGTQTVKDSVTFNNDVTVTGSLVAKGRTSLIQGNAVCNMYHSADGLVVQSQISNDAIYRLVIANNDGFQFYVNDTLTCTISEAGIDTSLSIKTKECIAGNISIENSGIINKGHADNSACVDINMVGFGGGKEYYRNTNIGNGKGSSIIAITGSSSLVQINGCVNIKSGSTQGLVLQCAQKKINPELVKTIEWFDADNSQIACIGYAQTSDNVFEIKNAIANISITGLEAVNIGPAIKENGVLLSNKYVTVTNLERLLAEKAGVSSVYTATQADNKFAVKNGGLSQFITTDYTKDKLRSQIEAVSAQDVIDKHPLKNNLLGDMATTEEKKKKILANIGAAPAGAYQDKLYDSGWVYVSGTTALYARQIGSVVCIQGTITTIHEGVVFTLPNSISAPSHSAVFSTAYDKNSPWTCAIKAGRKYCEVVYCSGACGERMNFTMTYMV